ncbi:MAG TPA: type VI secretion system baseplate subunit TssE [Acidobacteriaceae bacterium]|nr:type VI secretion system baseplate subunit TssE [Acidobacteriaceae bacterium]
MMASSADPSTLLDLLTQKMGGSRDTGAEAPGSYEDSLAANLQLLLNTRRQDDLVPPEFEECAASVLNFGVIDLTGRGGLQTPAEQMRLCRSFEQAVRLFEPRLRQVSVRPVEQKDRNLSVRFRLEAWAEAIEERITFEVRLKRDTGEIQVSQP